MRTPCFSINGASLVDAMITVPPLNWLDYDVYNALFQKLVPPLNSI
jgi:hypothetical protein